MADQVATATSATDISLEWEAIELDGVDPALKTFFESNGLAKHALKIMDVTDAETLDDLKLVDASMVEEIIKTADLKLVSAKKLRLSLSQLRGEGAATVATEAAAAAAAGAAAPSSGMPLDAACPNSESQQRAPVALQESVVICIDRSGSMGSPFAELTINVVEKAVVNRTRMEAVKAMFYAFRDRTDSVAGGKNQMGLIQFDDKIERLLDLTPNLNKFESIVDDVEKRGQTAIYSAIVESVRMLESQFDAESSMDLRIVVLTDGQNNAGDSPEQALRAVNGIGAVVDAIIVGSQPDSNLRKIVSSTGGECWQINNLGEGFELLEAESVVSLHARRGGAAKPPFQLREMVDLSSVLEKTITSGSAVKSAQVLAPDLATKAVVSASAMDTAKMTSACPAGAAGLRRIMKELEKAALDAGEGIHIFPASDDVRFWRVLLEGPADSPFNGGVFQLSVQIPESYPFNPPKIMFITPVYHCNVSDSGQICLDVLGDSWNPALTVPKAIEEIRIMLSNPNTNDALRQWVAEVTIAHFNSNGADVRYYEKAGECTKQHACKTVADWKSEWGC